MSISMYSASVPVYQRMLVALGKVLAKAEAHATARKIDPAVLLNARLYPDMFALTRQVQIAADHAKGVARLAGIEPPAFADNESSFADLQARITKTLDYIATLKPDQIDGSDDREIEFKIRDHVLKFKGQDYLLGFSMPNFYFHITTAYDILRHNGVEVGKRDFLGA